MECQRKAQAVGGLIFRCECCPKSYCEDHLPIDADLIGHCARFEKKLGMRHPDQACYIHCSKECSDWAKEGERLEEEEAAAKQASKQASKQAAKGAKAETAAKSKAKKRKKN